MNDDAKLPVITGATCWSPQPGDLLLVGLKQKPTAQVMQQVQDEIAFLLKKAGYTKGQIQVFVYAEDMIEFKFIRKETIQ